MLCYLRSMGVKKPKFGAVADPDVIVDHGDGSYTLFQTKISASQRKRARVKVGGVYVTGDKASAAQVKQSVAMSADMLERLSHKITRPGVRLKTVRDIPLFSADPEHPDRFLRKLNGKIERGVLENGAFKVVD